MADPRAGVTGKRIILEIVREMREGLHPLLYSRVAPGLYCVYLHPEDFSRIEGLIPRVRGEAQRALAEEMRRLNAPSKPPALRWFVADDPSPPVEEPAGGWVIQIEADRDDEVAPGTFVILSKLSLPPLPQFEGGAPTTKVFKTVISGESRTKTEQVFAAPPTPAPAPALTPALAAPGTAATAFGATSLGATGVGPAGVGATGVGATVVGATGVAATGVGATGVGTPAVGTTAVGAAPVVAPPLPVRASQPGVRGLAEIAVQDAHGHRIFVMDKQDIKVGRGGQFRLVDLQLDGSTRISRVHARIRRDEQGRFFIKDLSEWGTTVNGQRIARGVIREGEEVREIDVESELPTRARIGLADAVYLEFTAAPAPATPTATASASTTTTTAVRTERVRDLPAPATLDASESAEASAPAALRADDGPVAEAGDALSVPRGPVAVGAPDDGAGASGETRPASGAVVFISDAPSGPAPTESDDAGITVASEPITLTRPAASVANAASAAGQAAMAAGTGRVTGAGGRV